MTIKYWWDTLSVAEAYDVLCKSGAYRKGFDALIDESWEDLPTEVKNLIYSWRIV